MRETLGPRTIAQRASLVAAAIALSTLALTSYGAGATDDQTVSPGLIEALGYPEQMSFMADVADDVAPYARSLDTFGGIWLDRSGDGKLVVALTQDDPAVAANLRARMPTAAPRLEIVIVDHSYARLVDGLSKIHEAWSSINAEITPVTWWVNEQSNDLSISFTAEDLQHVSADDIASLQDSVGVPIRATEEAADHDST